MRDDLYVHGATPQPLLKNQDGVEAKLPSANKGMPSFVIMVNPCGDAGFGSLEDGSNPFLLLFSGHGAFWHGGSEANLGEVYVFDDTADMLVLPVRILEPDELDILCGYTQDFLEAKNTGQGQSILDPYEGRYDLVTTVLVFVCMGIRGLESCIAEGSADSVPGVHGLRGRLQIVNLILNSPADQMIASAWTLKIPWMCRTF